MRSWSKKVPGRFFDPRDLDVYVLKEHDEVIAALGRSRTRSRVDPDGLPGFLTVLAPALALVAWGGALRAGTWELGGMGSAAPEWIAGCFLVTVLGLVLVGLRWWRYDRQRDRVEMLGAVVSWATGLIALFGLYHEPRVDVLGFSPVTLPVWGSVVLAAGLGLAMAFGSSGPRVPFRRYFKVTGPPDVTRAQMLIQELGSQRQAKLMKERRKAVRRLADRGLLDKRSALDLTTLPLGRSVTFTPPTPPRRGQG